MRILVLTKYPAKGPSSRYRFYQFLPALAEAGIEAEVFPFFSTSYLDNLFSGKGSTPFYLVQRCFLRLIHSVQQGRFDLVWIEGELFPYLPAGFERLLHGVLPEKRVYEFDDANWLRYEARPMLARKFETILSTAAGVVVGNPFLAAYTKRFCERTEVVPTVVDWRKYANASPGLDGCTLGWIGSQNTYFYLESLFPVFERLAETHSFKLKIVGAQADKQVFETESVAWHERSEVALIESFDIGLMPLTATAWSEGKCGLKLIQYLATGVPAIASPVGVNKRILADSGGGCLVDCQDDWLNALKRLLDEEPARREMGGKGRIWAEAEMTVQVQAPRLVAFLEQIAES